MTVPGIDPRLPTPLYHQVYTVLRDRILAGAFGDEGLIPGEHELSRDFAVSRITLRRAMEELVADGLVERQRGRGTRVVRRLPDRPVAGAMEGLLENLLMIGLKTDVRVLEFDYRVPAAAVLRALDLPPDTEVQRAVRVRSQKGVPLSYAVSFVPAEVGRRYDAEALKTRPLLALLEASGIQAASAEQSLSAQLADQVTGPALDVPVGSALLSLTRTVYDPDGRPVEHLSVLYRPDRYRYRMVLRRDREGPANVWAAAGDPQTGKGKAK